MKTLICRTALVYYDGIQVLEGIDEGGASYVGVLVESTEGRKRYVVVGVSIGSILRFRNGALDLRSLLLENPRAEWFFGDLPEETDLPMQLVVQQGVLAGFDRLPDPGFYLPQEGEVLAAEAARPDPATEFLKMCLKTGASPEEAFANTIKVFGPADARTARSNAKAEIHRIYVLRDPPILADNELVEWYPGPSKDDRFWPSLVNYLRVQRRWEQPAIDELDRASTQVVSRIAPPGMPVIRTRGLVVGYVQSGKTANFTAVIAKAADVHYRLFVVLSGLTNSLRSQTQQRLEKELTSQVPAGGWMTLTTVDSDFSGNIPFKADVVLNQGNGPRILAVLKKNGNRLRRFIKWLEGTHPDIRRNCAILVIDDEADQASINTSKNDAERSKINALLVHLLREMPKVAYVGYTATPFANVLNEPPGGESLYPSNFIITLPRPKTYFGPEKIFGRERLNSEEEDTDIDGLDMVRLIPDAEASTLHEVSTGGVLDVPRSLDEALRYFLMATAARFAREGQIDFSTMMIHTTQRVVGHNLMRDAIASRWALLAGRLKQGDSEFKDQLRLQWESETERVSPADAGSQSEPVAFDKIVPHLARVMQSAEFIVDNYISPARLDFSRVGRILVVTGGNTLARGLTVEGLVTSYFIRTSTAYDTLMQMGRWFGYRPSYEDLPRIWMTDELRDYFFDLATIEEEFRSEVRRYTLGLTPKQFGPRIRTHPALMITSRLKMQAAINAFVSYGGMRCQTILFQHRNNNWLRGNLDAAQNLITAAARSAGTVKGPENGHIRLLDVPATDVLGFFEGYAFHPQSRELNRDLLLKYVRAQNAVGFLLKWNVVVVGQSDETRRGAWKTSLGAVGFINRSRMKEGNPDRATTANIKSLMSRVDIVADLDAAPEFATFSHEELQKLRNAKLPNHGLLLLYPISKDSVPARRKDGEENQQRENLDAVENVLGIAVVLPEPAVETPQAYVTVDMSRVSREEPEYPPAEEAEDAA
jgi:hypothetical protein